MAAKKPPLRLSFKQAMAELKKFGTAQNRKVYGRHGVTGDLFGVSFANLGKLQKRIKLDHELALALWETKNFDAMNLATMVVDAEQMTSLELDAWVRNLDNHAVVDTFVKVAARSRFAHKKAETWRKRKGQWVSRAGWMVVASIASRGDQADQAWLASLLPEITATIHTSKNRVKDAMNYALIAIGGTHEALTKRALLAADRIGVVEVDHGETGCKTRGARDYIEAMLTRGQAARKKAKKKTAKR